VSARVRHRSLEEAGVWELLTDQPLPPRANRFLEHTSPSKLRELWRRHGTEILTWWLAHRSPGTRPSRWWRAMAPGRLLRVEGGLESQAAFLVRNGLLQPGEAERIPSSAFEPILADEYGIPSAADDPYQA
jgi:hypothetical protein